MSDTYYWRRRKQVQGPFDAVKMKDFYDNGSLNATHEISTDGTTWFPAGELIGTWVDEGGYSAGGGGGGGGGGGDGGGGASDDSDGALTLEDNEWHFEHDGASKGPIPYYQLQQLFATGRLTPQTRVWKEGLPDWQAASTIPGLVPDPHSSDGNAGANTSQDQPTNPAVFSALGSSRPWATFLAIVLLIMGGLGVIGGIVIFIQGAKYENEFAVYQGIGSIIGSGTTVTVAIILLQFSSLANTAQIQRTDRTLLAALDGLRRYFLVQGMVVLLLLSMVLLLVILQAALF